MPNALNRRSFIKQSALAAGAVASVGYFPGISRAQTPKTGRKLNIVQIGCGNRAMAHLEGAIGVSAQNLLAIVDPDERRFAAVNKWYDKASKKSSIAPIKPQTFTDYRVMFDKLGKNIDAVFIATPNHHHAPASMLALQRGINVYCEKPLCHDIAEARTLRAMAAKYPKLATQMGNQGHCMDGYRSLCEYIWAGAIGNVTETHSWTNRANGGVGPRPPAEKVPAGMNWEAWIGPAPFRDYHADLHPHEWHGWYDFGNGSIGNMACHVMDGLFWALKLEHPTSIETEYLRGGTEERFPTGTRIRWDCPARGQMPPVKVYWYDGLSESKDARAEGEMRQTNGNSRNRPPLLIELEKKYPDEEFASSGTLYVGDKGVIVTADYGDRMHIVPIEKMKEFPKPPQTLPRPKDVFTDFIEAVQKGSSQTASPFEYGARLTEFSILGNLAQHAGVGKKLEWDGPNMKVKNFPEFNQFIHTTPRDGWKV